MTDSTTGIRVKAFNQPNFPPDEPRGTQELTWGTDLISDPADPGEASVTDGWQRGIGIGALGSQD